MTAWITALCVTAVGCGVLVALKPRREGGVGKGVSFTASLLMLTVLLSPLPNLIGKVRELFPQDFSSSVSLEKSDAMQNWVLGVSSDEIGRRISEYIALHYGGDTKGMKIMLTLDRTDPGAVRIVRVTVDLRACTVLYGAEELQKELSSLLSCETTVLVR